MSDPVTERAHYLAVGGDGSGDLFLIQRGCVEHLGRLRLTWRLRRTKARGATGPPPPDERPPDGLRRRIATALGLLLVLPS
jgi:hypothetical protein